MKKKPQYDNLKTIMKTNKEMLERGPTPFRPVKKIKKKVK